jgi:hypothetical protein
MAKWNKRNLKTGVYRSSSEGPGRNPPNCELCRKPFGNSRRHLLTPGSHWPKILNHYNHLSDGWFAKFGRYLIIDGKCKRAVINKKLVWASQFPDDYVEKPKWPGGTGWKVKAHAWQKEYQAKLRQIEAESETFRQAMAKARGETEGVKKDYGISWPELDLLTKPKGQWRWDLHMEQVGAAAFEEWLKEL